jgi:hypothetical protein
MAIQATSPGVVITWPLGAHGQLATMTTEGKVNDYTLGVKNAADVTLRGLTFDGLDDITSGQRSMGVIYKSSSGLVDDCIFFGYRENATSGAQNGIGFEADQSASIVDVINSNFFNIQKGHVVVKSGATVNLTGCVFTGRGVTSSIAQNGVQFGGTNFGLDAIGSVVNCTFSGFWYDGGFWTSAGVLNFDSGPDILVNGNTFTNCQSGVIDVANVFKVTTQITNNIFEQTVPWVTGVAPIGVFMDDGNGANDYRISGNVFRGHADTGVWLETKGGTVVQNFFDGNGVVYGENARDDATGFGSTVWDSNKWSDILTNPLGPGAYLIPGAAGSIDGSPLADAAALIYGTGNPAGSLTVVAGLPRIGTVFTVGIDNPLGTQSSGSGSIFAIAALPQLNFPNGIFIPGWGQNGGAGELLIDINPFSALIFFGGTIWGGPGTKSLVNIPIPYVPDLVGLSVYGQGMMIDPFTFGNGLGITNAVKMTFCY